VPVLTIRFYCDEGLLAPARSVGGHRRFDPSAVSRPSCRLRRRSSRTPNWCCSPPTARSACELAFPQVTVGSPPEPGPALDLFVAAHATALGTSGTPEFRRALNRRTAADRHPQVRRYWHLADEITGEPAPVGVAHTWLLDVLAAQSVRTTLDSGQRGERRGDRLRLVRAGRRVGGTGRGLAVGARFRRAKRSCANFSVSIAIHRRTAFDHVHFHPARNICTTS
jgi:hypothetical protein